jgi:hypothetical protein
VVVKELFAKLGLEVDNGMFAAADRALGTLRLGTLAVGTAIAAGVAAMYSLASETRDYAVEASKAAQRTGLTVEAWQELKAAGEATGLEAGALEHSLILMSKAAYGAAEGSDEMGKTFARLGIHTKDANGHLKGGDVLLSELAEKFSRMPDGIAKTALATRAFGRSGAEMLPFLNKGAEGIAELRHHAHELGLVLDQETIEAAKQWKKEMREMSERIEGLKLQLGAKLLHGFMALKKGIGETAKVLGSFFKTFVDHAKSTAIALGIVAGAFLVATIAAAAHAGTLGMVVSWYAALGVASVIAGVKAAAAWVAAAAPIVGLVALVAALLLMWEDFLVFLDGGDSLIGELGPKWTKFVDSFLREDSDDWWVTKKIKEALRWLTDLTDGSGTQRAVQRTETRKLQDQFDSVSDDGFAGWWKRHVMIRPSDDISPTDARFGGGASPAAAAASSAGARGATVTTIHAPITVNAQTNADPHEIAGMVGKHVQDVIDTHHREAAAAVQ